MQKLEVGQRIYNGGDQANPSHFGAITAIRDDKWGLKYEVTPDPDDFYPWGAYWIDAISISPVYLGHGGTRIVTVEAFEAWHAARMAAFETSAR